MMNIGLRASSLLRTSSAIPDRVTSADRMGGGLVITFENGKTAVYSAALLKQTFQHAQEITGLAFEWGASAKKSGANRPCRPISRA